MTETEQKKGIHFQLSTALVWLILAAIACGTFAVFYSLNGLIIGRDSGYHAIQFYHSFFNSDVPAGTSSIFTKMYTPNYGPAIKFLIWPLWKIFGSFPWVFGLLNLLLFFATILLLQKLFKVLKADSHWILILGILVFFSPMGLTMYQHYNVDALTTFAAMFPLLFFLDNSRKTRCDLLLAGLAVSFGLFIRINVCFYLIVPLAYEIIDCFQSRKGFRWFSPGVPSLNRIAGWITFFILTGVVLNYYFPRLADIFQHVQRTNDFNFENTAIVSGLWTWDNWTWFIRYGFRAFPILWSVISIPLAILGWWKGFQGRRLRSIFYAIVPVVIYSFILGTRKVEYIAPSLILWQLCAMMGIGYLKRFSVRWVLITVLLVCSVFQMWWSQFGMSPSHLLQDQHTTSILSKEYTGLLPIEKYIGTTHLVRNVLDLAYPEKEALRIGIASHDPSFSLFKAPGILQPFFEKTDKSIQKVIVRKAEPMDCSGLDALLLLEPEKTGAEGFKKHEEKLNGSCRRIARITLHKRHQAAIYLPWP